MSSSDRATALVDLCAGLFAFVIELQSANVDARVADGMKFDVVASRAREQLAKLDRSGREHGFGKDAVDQAKYAITALIDEVVLSSRLPCRDEWMTRPMAAELFSDFNAGEEFFKRLDTLSRGGRLDPQTLGVLEVFAACLSLGFKGMHIEVSGAERLREVLYSLCRRINEGRETTPLAPHWEQRASVAGSVRRLPTWMLITAGVIAALLVFGLFELLISWDASILFDKLNSRGG